MDPSTFHLDHARCAAAVSSRDRRFDGWFVTAVLSTGIYCRPSCPAMTPKLVNMSFYRSAAAAQAAGFRACKRCLPDATPGSPEWHVRGDVVARAVRLVADGVVEREGVGGLAERLGYSTRQVERLVGAELGAGPLALARAQRAQAARVLLESTDLPMSEVTFAAGFASIRSFNDTVRTVYGATPSELRAGRRGRGARARRGPAVREVRGDLPDAGALVLRVRLAFRAPLHVPSLFGHLAATAVPGLEVWRAGRLERSLSLPHGCAVVRLAAPGPEDRHVEAELSLEDGRDLTTAIQRCRGLLDLDADPAAVDARLSSDPALAPLVAATPGVRLPGTVDAGEMLVRAVLGQQVSTAAAATQTARLVSRLGAPLPPELVQPGGPTHLFPTAAAIAGAADGDLPGMPSSRRRTLRAVAEALADGRLDLGPGSSWEQAREQLLALPGIGPWTAEIVALRGLGDPDAFPSTDLGVRLAAQAVGLPSESRALTAHAERWRPWRSYAVQLLWASSDHAVARLPQTSTEGDTMSTTSPTPRHTRVTIDSPVGPLALVSDGEHVTGVFFETHKHAPADLGTEVALEDAPAVLRSAAEQLAEYFRGERQEFDLPVAAVGTEFQRRVWALLRTIPYGQTWSYGQLATALGQPGASRAVGLANGRNPISIIVPCHRVVGADGSITGYGGGIERKQHLLDLERGATTATATTTTATTTTLF
ncbi:methylated-DNA--[protein]-cysteine S-methyltransferase [Ornithinimicrobium tianjinense]|uniref:Methylated-DNA--protein-cysteine methyltransferase n=1 Tax=Ornithinimicrobium tianjinense TaxID=1195761 RepID=A0A917EZR8_9MICO|nr:methylated-DNA--[protein]-cysteine S-methyltransferase [Ornithinimicrobium tianjinense]GGF37733.1 hypothetical protein GCM10011366_01560 [Ornithinimicrobium tianjinense]